MAKNKVIYKEGFKTVTLLEENISSMLSDIILNNIFFLDLSSLTKTTRKINKKAFTVKENCHQNNKNNKAIGGIREDI